MGSFSTTVLSFIRIDVAFPALRGPHVQSQLLQRFCESDPAREELLLTWK